MASISFGIAGEVNKGDTLADIEFLLEEILSIDVQRDPFYKLWLKDIAQVCSYFVRLSRVKAFRCGLVQGGDAAATTLTMYRDAF